MDNMTHFEITDDLKAKWAADKIREKRADLAELKQWYADQYAAAEARTINDIDHLEMLLYVYFLRCPHRVTKTGVEKYKFPGGELVLTPPKEAWQHDDAALLEWLDSNGHADMVKVKRTPAWDEVKRMIMDTGELPDGVTMAESPAKFAVKVTEEADSNG